MAIDPSMPKKLQGDEGTVEQHDIDKQMQADVYSRAVEYPPYGMRIARMIPNGSVAPGASSPSQR